MRVHHLGYACANIESALLKVKSLFNVISVSDVIFDELQDASLCLIEVKDSHRIELVCGNAVHSFVNSGAEINLYHVCYEVDDIHAAIQEYSAGGAIQVSELKPAILFNGRLVTFLQSDFGLIELLQKEQFAAAPHQKIVIAATFTADPVQPLLAHIMKCIDFNYNIELAPYNQVFQELLNENSLMNVNKSGGGFNILLIKLDDFIRYRKSTDNNLYEWMQKNTNELVNALQQFIKSSTAPLILVLCPSSIKDDAVKGYVQQLEMQIGNELEKTSIQLISSKDLLTKYRVDDYHDLYTDQEGHLPYTQEFSAAISLTLARKIFSNKTSGFKVIVVDCDNTLWKGVCGEAEPHELIVDDARQQFQQFLVEKQQSGFLICLNSKNNEDDVLRVFKSRKDMPLSIEHITDSTLNWNSKSENLKSLASRLNLGLDSFIFIDDNPQECAEVKTNCPQVLVVQLPTDEKILFETIKNHWAFDQHRVTDEDKKRSQLYQQNIQRQKAEENSSSYQDFIEGLDLKTTITDLIDPKFDRAVQLTQRTNQFNFITARRTESDIRGLLKAGYRAWLISVADRFGDYGDVGLVIFKKNENSIEIEDFLLSCRVLGKGVEHFILSKLCDYALENDCDYLKLKVITTARNVPAQNFVNELTTAEKVPINNGFLYTISAVVQRNIKYEPKQPKIIKDDNNKQLNLTTHTKNYNEKIYEIITKKFLTPKALLEDLYSRSSENSVNDVDLNVNLETEIAQLWRRLLNIDTIGLDDNFFSLGGNSIAALQFLTQLRTKVKKNFSLRDFFDHPTITEFSAVINNSNRDVNVSKPLKQITRTDHQTGPIPISFSQEALWLHDQVQPKQWAYNMPCAWVISGSLNIDTLKKAFEKIVKRHSVLRTTFDQDQDGNPQQVICNEISIPFEICNIEDPSYSNIQSIYVSEQKKPFDLQRGPLYRIKLLRCGDDSYVLIMIFHHIIFDGFSYKILYKELESFYKELQRGETSIDTALDYQCADYSINQRDEYANGEFDKELIYWKQQLADLPKLDVPLDFERPKFPTFDGEYIDFQLDQMAVNNLKKIAKSHNLTPYMILLSVFDLVLTYVTKQFDIVLGTPLHGRTKPQLANSIGCFINLIVLNTKMSVDLTFEQILKENKALVISAIENQNIPFQILVQELVHNRSLNENPLFQVLFVHQLGENFKLHLPNLTVNSFVEGYKIARYDLILETTEEQDTIKGGFYYNTNLFKQETILKYIDLFLRVCQICVENPDRTVSDILSAIDKPYEIGWKGEAISFPYHMTASQLFEQQVLKNPDAIAIDCDGNKLTYNEINQSANKLAYRLKEDSVGRNDIVVFLIERGNNYLISMLAVWKVGAAFIPLHTKHPNEKNRLIVDQAKPKVLLVMKDYLNQAQQITNTPVVIIEDVISSNVSTENLISQSNPNDLAYVIFTSGSTGIPKGAMVSQKAMVNHLFAKIHDLRLTANDNIAQVATQIFDVSVWQYIAILLVGGRVTVFSDSNAWDPLLILPLIEESKVTVFQTVPTQMHVILDELEKYPKRYNLSRLRWFITSGEALQPSLCARWFKLFPKIPLVNAYGPTECADNVTHFKLYGTPSSDWVYVPISGTLPNMKVYVLDADLKPVSIGADGELYIGGESVGIGYLNDPEKTRQCFVPDPFSGSADARMYKTGDRVKVKPNGELEFLSRLDNQVKVRGMRIELGEIESVLNKYSDVSEAIVTVHQEADYNKILVAYVTRKPGENVSDVLLRKFLSEKLPEYMVPSIFFILDRFPLTMSGKIDRKALPTPISEQKNETTNYVAPDSELEKTIALIWEEVIKVKPISVNADFFELGGHSLSATKVISRIRNVVNIDIPVKSIFEAQTIRALSALISEKLSANKQEKIRINRVERKKSHISSYSQQRIWFLDQYQPGNVAYNICSAIRLIGKLDYALINKAFDILAQRHESLRTMFAMDDNEKAMQEVKSEINIPIKILNNVNEYDVEKFLLQELNIPFDLAVAPLFRIVVVKITDDENIVAIYMHHIITDRWSLNLIFKEFSEIYTQLSNGQIPESKPLNIQYIDYSEWQRSGPGVEIIRNQMQYWRTKLAGELPILGLPYDFSRPSKQSFNGDLLYFSIVKPTSKKLNEVAAREKTSLFCILVSVFFTLLYKYSNQKDIVIGSPIANRHYAETEGIIGFFVNTIVLRCDLNGNPNFSELVKRIKELTLGAFAYQDVPFERLVEELQLTRDLSRSPIFQTMFVMQNTDLSEVHFQGLTMETVDIRPKTSKFDLTLMCEEMPDGSIKGSFEYNTDLFKKATIERMVNHLLTLTEEIVLDPNKALNDYAIVTSNEMEKINEWNNTEVKFPHLSLLHEKLAEIVKDKSDDLAVISATGNLTYHDLDMLSNKIAQKLRSFNVRPNQLVAVVMEKGWEQVAAVFGILKSGAAYLPINASEPAKRMNALLVQGEVTVVLTQKKHLELIPAGLTVLPIDDKGLFEAMIDHPLDNIQKSNDLAYVIFTSGSTGVPKGVMVSHANAVNTIQDINHRFKVNEADCIFGISALNFDLSVYDIFGSALVGAKLLLPNENETKDPGSWFALFTLNKITIWDSTPALMEMFVEYLEATNKVKEKCLHNLRLVLLSGDWIPSNLPDRIRSIFGDITIISMGGATEGSIWSIIYPINELTSDWKSIPYGKAMANQKFYVLNSGLQPCPIGVPGELYIGGAGVAQGYWKDDVKTKNSFIKHPRTSEKLYKTGDLGKYREDGNIEFLGRLDYQIKIRGYRVELGEIESKLKEYPDIKECIVIIYKGEADRNEGNEQLVTYYTTHNKKPINKADLVAHLAQSLPSYMVPQAYVHLIEFLITANGKIDRNSLRQPSRDDWSDSIEYVAPRDEFEKSLALLWAELLEIDVAKIGIYNNFFSIGGHSLLAARLIIKINKKFNISLSVREIFEFPNIAGLCERIKKETWFSAMEMAGATSEEGEI